MSDPFGIAVHKTPPAGEVIGAIYWHEGEKYYVTQAELDRIEAMPSAEEIRLKMDAMRRQLGGKP